MSDPVQRGVPTKATATTGYQRPAGCCPVGLAGSQAIDELPAEQRAALGGLFAARRTSRPTDVPPDRRPAPRPRCEKDG